MRQQPRQSPPRRAAARSIMAPKAVPWRPTCRPRAEPGGRRAEGGPGVRPPLGAAGTPPPTAPLGSRSRARLALAARVTAGRAGDAPRARVPTALLAAWLLLCDEPAADLPAILAARQVHLAPAEEATATAADAPTGLYLASGGPPQPLRAAPDRTAEALVQVPDGATLDDLGEVTPDGAWRHVAWDGWDGWIAAGLLLRRP